LLLTPSHGARAINGFGSKLPALSEKMPVRNFERAMNQTEFATDPAARLVARLTIGGTISGVHEMHVCFDDRMAALQFVIDLRVIAIRLEEEALIRWPVCGDPDFSFGERLSNSEQTARGSGHPCQPPASNVQGSCAPASGVRVAS